MCGGRGTRLDADVEKPLFPVDAVPMVDRVRAALADSGVEDTHAVVSPHAPATRRHLEGDVALIETPGEGFVADLRSAMERVGTPVLAVAADLPLLEAGAVDRILARAADAPDASLTTCVPTVLKRRLGVSVATDRTTAPTGVNVVRDTDTETMHVTTDHALAVNVNRSSDAAVAEALLCE